VQQRQRPRTAHCRGCHHARRQRAAWRHRHAAGEWPVTHRHHRQHRPLRIYRCSPGPVSDHFRDGEHVAGDVLGHRHGSTAPRAGDPDETHLGCGEHHGDRRRRAVLRQPVQRRQPAGKPHARGQRGVRPYRREQVRADAERGDVDVLHRRRHGVVQHRAPDDRLGGSPAARRGARRGDDQLLYLVVSRAYGRQAVLHHDRSRGRAVESRSSPHAHRTAGREARAVADEAVQSRRWTRRAACRC
jgi:hypothetical protein